MKHFVQLMCNKSLVGCAYIFGQGSASLHSITLNSLLWRLPTRQCTCTEICHMGLRWSLAKNNNFKMFVFLPNITSLCLSIGYCFRQTYDENNTGGSHVFKYLDIFIKIMLCQ